MSDRYTNATRDLRSASAKLANFDSASGIRRKIQAEDIALSLGTFLERYPEVKREILERFARIGTGCEGIKITREEA